MSSAAHSDCPGSSGLAQGIFGLAPEDVDRLALVCAVLMNRLALPIARAAASYFGRKGWHEDGFANAHDYARERLGRSAEWLRGMARLGKATQEWPRLEQALLGADGGEPLNTVAAEWICRVAREETLEQWIALARQETVGLLKLEGELRRCLGRLLVVLGAGGGFRELGFVDLGQYAEERLGVARTTAQDLAQAARFSARH